MPHTLSYCALIGKCALIRSNTVGHAYIWSVETQSNHQNGTLTCIVQFTNFLKFRRWGLWDYETFAKPSYLKEGSSKQLSELCLHLYFMVHLLSKFEREKYFKYGSMFYWTFGRLGIKVLLDNLCCHPVHSLIKSVCLALGHYCNLKRLFIKGNCIYVF